MEEKKCPMDKPVCKKDCAWSIEGKCAVAVIAEKLSDAADVVGALKRSREKT